jgi:hypothetical protein
MEAEAEKYKMEGKGMGTMDLLATLYDYVSELSFQTLRHSPAEWLLSLLHHACLWGAVSRKQSGASGTEPQ